MTTKEAIANLYNKFNEWGMLEGLTDNERESVFCDLEQLAGTAIIESHNKIKDILPNFYTQITK